MEQPGKTVKRRDPRARRPAASGTLIGADRAGGLVSVKKGNASNSHSIHQGSRRSVALIGWTIDVIFRIASLIVLCSLVNLPAFAESLPGTRVIVPPGGSPPLCEEQDCGYHSILDQLIYLLPGDTEKKGFTVFVPGGVSSSDKVLESK